MDAQTKALSLIAAYRFGFENGLGREVDEIRSMAIDGFRNKSSVRRSHIAHLFRERGLLDQFISNHWGFARTAEGQKKLRYYERLRRKHLDLLGGADEDNAAGPDEDEASSAGDQEEEQVQRFALEADLRDFLARNLTVLEPGLRLYADGNRSGIEFPIDRGHIDILAVDKNDKFVVVELKLSHGRNKALGQLMYYMGWVDEHLGRSPCRGVIVAGDISDELVTALRRVPGVSLFRYRISMSVEAVPVPGS